MLLLQAALERALPILEQPPLALREIGTLLDLLLNFEELVVRGGQLPLDVAVVLAQQGTVHGLIERPFRALVRVLFCFGSTLCLLLASLVCLFLRLTCLSLA